jgi:hypothetical protein
MLKVFPGRYTVAIDEPFIVFLIGMRANRIIAVRKWAANRAGDERNAARDPSGPSLAAEQLGGDIFERKYSDYRLDT